MTKHYCIFIVMLGFLGNISANDDVDFKFAEFSATNITLLGDSYLRNGTVGLTKALEVPTTSAGRALYWQPVKLFDKKSKISASFSTRFSFSISNINSASGGEGLAFVLVSDNQTIGSAGPFLGLINSTQTGNQSKVIAVEFDTFFDVQFNDINDNHVGLDIGNLTSVASVDVGTLQMDLNNGDLITSWIDYNATEKMIRVWLSYASQRPSEPLMNVSIDLSHHFEEFMFVGFSASTGGSTELHLVQDWSFKSSGLGHLAGSRKPLKYGPAASPEPSSSSISPALSPSNHKRCNGHFYSKRNLMLWIIGGTSVAAILALFLGLCSWVLYKKWKQSKLSESFKNEMEKFPRKFTYKELYNATNGFNPTRILGNGSFGTVYRGTLPGSAVAVKRSVHDNQGKEFRAELCIIGRLRHRNLVHLQGWCHDKGEFLLVYEYMPNGSLDKVLFQETANLPILSWGQRHKIVTGVASALVYLHEGWEQQVIHRDIKASNIMLDATFNARLGDFGLARLMDHNKSPDATLTAGTMGYLAPEYILSGKASEKTDVFSFGAVALEVACGRRPIEEGSGSLENKNLVDWVWGLHGRGRLLDAADPRLEGEFSEEEMRRMLLVGLCCSNPDPLDRPSMRQVLQILGGEAPPPSVPLFKPRMSFASTLTLNIQDVFSELGPSLSSSHFSASSRD